MKRTLSLAAMAAAAMLAASAASAASLKILDHGSRGAAELDAIAAQVAAWNRSHPDIPAELVTLPKPIENQTVQAKALAGTWPDILDFDGPSFANAAWAGLLAPLDDLLPPDLMRALLPSIRAQGLYAPDGKIYALGQFDSGLGLWASRSALRQAGIRIPSGLDDAWTGEEFEAALAALKRAGYPTPLDMKLNYGVGEWYTYGFAPILQSYGGDLINRTTWQAEGTINSEASIAALGRIQSWMKAGYIVPASEGDDAFYGKRSAALALVGHWMWPTHSAALGSDLVLLPMPRFGARHVTGMGSWNWGIWSGSPNKEAAAKFLEFLMSEPAMEAVAGAAGAIPSRQAAAERNPLFRQGGPMALYREQLTRIAVPRPPHPAYPVISRAFAAAVNSVMKGEDPKRALDRAAAAIDQEIEQTNGYKPFGG
ncbi:extracellular solute-binding protein family 1 [Methylobacterium sp. 4-46]|uniref:extracellular solute-binding protein n=1 Tax=unclassified Methylobacterium TaxID=2615210 RepID=UPI000152CFA2|nr:MULTISPECIES: extracellular solute-binding protein [Methylobacterium]ACA17816.1 extracellular solute-binding protein family 1 [Methylobacterium sp. 4-46]WFT77123.1 extracellular solute-binding protein [Methylobacterium nodulans]